MTGEQLQRMNLRTIRVTLRAALRSVGPEQAELCIARAQQLLAHARDQASSPALIAEIQALQTELDAGRIEQRRQS